MDKELKRKCLERIEDYLLDEKNIVTYKLLSQEMDIHVNVAKQLLAEFVSLSPPDVSRRLSVTFAVGGRLPGTQGLSYRLVRRGELAAARARFAAVTTEHVYSVQLGSDADWGLLALAAGVQSCLDIRHKAAILHCKNKKVAEPASEGSAHGSDGRPAGRPAEERLQPSEPPANAAKRPRMDGAEMPSGPGKGKGPAKGGPRPRKGAQRAADGKQQTSLTSFFRKT